MESVVAGFVCPSRRETNTTFRPLAIKSLRADFDLERSYGLAAPPALITQGVCVKFVGIVPRTL